MESSVSCDLLNEGASISAPFCKPLQHVVILVNVEDVKLLTSRAEVPRCAWTRGEEVGLHCLDVKRITCSRLTKSIHGQVREQRLKLRSSK